MTGATEINVGDVVVALRDAGHDPDGYPRQRPMVGRYYRVTSIYAMHYGLGCTLEGMDPFPYRGYFLRVQNGPRARRGWYFKKLELANAEFTQTLYELLRSKGHEFAN